MAIEDVKLGVCTVMFNAVDLGMTKGGVEVEVATETHKVMVDQYGNAPINEYITARSVVARVPLAESTLENIVATMPGATLVTDGIDATKKRVDVVHSVGTNLLDSAAALILHPQANAAADKNDDFTIPKAAVAGAMTYSFKLDEERIFNVEFNGYPDLSASGLLFQVGDDTATP